MRGVWNLRSRGLSDSEMPLVRYFVVAGSALLLTLLVGGAWLPQAPLDDGTAASAELPVIRIHSDRKSPGPIVFDTRQQAAPLAKADAVPARPADIIQPPPPAAEKIAQIAPADPKPIVAAEVKKPHAKRRTVRARAREPLTLVAQRPYYWSFDMAR